MASTYTPLGVELMATGENAGTWGTKTNTNLEIIEQISGGFIQKSIAGGAQTTALAVSDGSTGAELAHRMIEFTGTITGNQIVTIPLDVQTFYILRNSTSGAYTVQFKYVSGSGSTFTFSTTNKGDKIIFAAANDGTNPDIISIEPTDTVTFKEGGTDFTNSLLLGNSTTGTLSSAIRNTGVGSVALDALTSGTNNTAVGYNAGTSLTTGSSNTAIGSTALVTSTNSTNNTAVGLNTLRDTSSGANNTAVGSQAGLVMSGGSAAYNTVIGFQAGDNISSGAGNVVIGSVDVDTATGNRQLKIAGNDGSTTTTWISGDSSGNLTIPGTVTANGQLLSAGISTGKAIAMAIVFG